MRHSCPILILLLAARTSFGGILYNNTIDTHATSGLTGSQAYILVDDVLIPTQRDPLDLPVAITQITVLVSAAPAASGQFSMWDFPVQVNGQVVSPGLPPTLIATTQHTFTNPFEQVSFGNGSTTLFTVTPNFTADPGYGLIYLGLSASADIVADWQWANGPDFNLPTAYLYNIPAGQIFLNTSQPGFPPNVSYDLLVQGQAVPEPAPLISLSTGLFGLVGYGRYVKRRRRGPNPAAEKREAGHASQDSAALRFGGDLVIGP